MADEANETKAQKLAAARKKLKAYQSRNANSSTSTDKPENSTIFDVVVGGDECLQHEHITTADSMSSSLSEKSDFELISNGHEMTAEEKSGTNTPPTPKPIEIAQQEFDTPLTPTVASYFGAEVPKESLTNNAALDQPSAQHITALQVVIAEKGQLTTELNKYRAACREKDFELEELRTQFNTATHRQQELQERCQALNHTSEQLRKSNAELQHKMALANAKSEDQTTHLDELQKQLSLTQAQIIALEQQLKEQRNEVEMTQIRLRQLDDESNISRDNRVETLTQTQFMYEQQIRDLQAMVQQLNQDKEQANSQYQNYVQHLNAEITNLNEKNAELSEECTKSQERDRQLVEHISSLEREIQKNICRQQEFQAQANTKPTVTANEYDSLKSQIEDFDLERHEFLLKIKSQEDRLVLLQTTLKQSQDEATELREQLEHNVSEQPDQSKLLATMESDKVAASRALSQNVTLKTQLNELEQRFVQLTNDKAELVNQRDAEEFANREMRNNYAALEQRLSSIDERLKFKDEEMIRLSHENVELEQTNLKLQQQLNSIQYSDSADEADKINEGDHVKTTEHNDNHHHDHDIHHHEHDNHHHDHENHHHDHDDQHHHEHVHPADNSSLDQQQIVNESADEVGEEVQVNIVQTNMSKTQTIQHSKIPTTEAVEKLEQRFTHLISQVADLTDEKHRLEHLVLQLQSETETIGEYIALYQTQRRMLKQREYEKAAQMQLLHEERERLRERINMLNELVHSLGVELPASEIMDKLMLPTSSLKPNNINEKLKTTETKEILQQIQHIISEIKENTEDTAAITPTLGADHLNCCLGKFEVV